ncbi:MAG: hypothetical protein WBV63_14530, partial [Candidatus Sulfotelmatobacter sp.]
VTLTQLHLLVMLFVMAHKSQKPGKHTRPPRIRVPNNERALFTVDAKKFVGVLRRLSLTGGSAVLTNGPIPEGTMGEMDLGTVFGKVTAQIEFMHCGADGMPLAQAFRFIDMDEISSKRFTAAAKQMEKAGFSDAEEKGNPLGNLASQTLSKLRNSIGNFRG